MLGDTGFFYPQINADLHRFFRKERLEGVRERRKWNNYGAIWLEKGGEGAGRWEWEKRLFQGGDDGVAKLFQSLPKLFTGVHSLRERPGKPQLAAETTAEAGADCQPKRRLSLMTWATCGGTILSQEASPAWIFARTSFDRI
jgi:hypothetical protein